MEKGAELNAITLLDLPYLIGEYEFSIKVVATLTV